MSKKRKVKKELKKLATELIAESKTFEKRNPDADKEKVKRIVDEIESKVAEISNKINHTDQVKDKKEYFNKLIEEQSELLISTLDKLGNK